MERAADSSATEPIRSDDLPAARTEGRPTLEEIAAEAYAIYLANGAGDGHDLDHWLEAEHRIIAKAHAPRQLDTDLQQDDRDRRHDADRERQPHDPNAAIL